MKHYLAILVLSIIAILIHGYQFAVSDQEIFIPYILKSVDNSLFPQDLLFQQPSTNLSIFYSIIGFLTRFLDIQVFFFIGYLIFQLLFFCGIYRFAKIILKDENLAYLSLIPFFLPKFIAGTATLTYDLFFGYRSIGVIFLLFYLSYLMEKKFKEAIFFATAGFLFHPLSIIPNILLLPAAFLTRSKIRFKKWQFLTAIILGVAFLALAKLLMFQNTKFIDDYWLSIIKFRDDYLFISTWKLRGWLALGLYLTLSFLFLPKLEDKFKKTILLFIIISLSVFIFNYLILEIFRIPLIAQFQLVRSIAPIAYIALAIAPLFLIYQNFLLKTLGVIAFGALSLNLFYVFLFATVLFVLSLIFVEKQARNAIPTKEISLIIGSIFILHLLLNFNSYKNFQQKIQFPKQANDWINLQLWVRTNTDKSVLFLVPPTQTGFRIFSRRPIVGDIKDGAVVIYDRNFAKKWYEVKSDLNDYDYMDTESFIKLKDKYSFNYLITKSNNTLNLEVIYRNNSYIVYRI